LSNAQWSIREITKHQVRHHLTNEIITHDGPSVQAGVVVSVNRFIWWVDVPD